MASNIIGNEWVKNLQGLAAKETVQSTAALRKFQGEQARVSEEQRTASGAAAMNAEQVRAQFVALGDSIQALYTDLIKQNKQAEAYALADATTRFARSGSQMGVNQWAQSQAITELKNRMQVASQLSTSQIIRDQITASTQNLINIGNLDQQTFTQAIQSSQFQAGLSQNGISAALDTGRLNYNMGADVAKMGWEASSQTQSQAQAQSQYDRTLAENQRVSDRNFAQEQGEIDFDQASRTRAIPARSMFSAGGPPASWGSMSMGGVAPVQSSLRKQPVAATPAAATPAWTPMRLPVERRDVSIFGPEARRPAASGGV